MRFDSNQLKRYRPAVYLVALMYIGCVTVVSWLLERRIVSDGVTMTPEHVFATFMMGSSLVVTILGGIALAITVKMMRNAPVLDELTVRRLDFNNLISLIRTPFDKNFAAVEKRLAECWYLNETLFQMSPVYIAIIGADSRVRMANRALLDRLGYTFEETEGLDYRDFTDCRDEKDILSIPGVVDISDGAPIVVVINIVAHDGSVVPVEWHGRGVNGTDGSIDYVFGIGIDITERVKKEEELRLKRVFEQYIATLSRRFFNLDMTALDKEVMRSLQECAGCINADCAFLYTFSDDLSQFSCRYEWYADDFNPAIRGKGSYRSADYPLFVSSLKAGNAFSFSESAPFPDSAFAERCFFKTVGLKSFIAVPITIHGALKGFLGMSVAKRAVEWKSDIPSYLTIAGELLATAIMRVDDAVALANSEERFALAMQAANEGLWEYVVPTKELFYSPRWYTMLGYQPDELPMSLDTCISLIHFDDRKRAIKLLDDYIDGKTDTYHSEYRMKSKQNGWRWILSRGNAVEWNSSGAPFRVIGTHVDITDLKQIMREKEQIASLIENSSQFIGMADLLGSVTYINEAGLMLVGKDKNAVKDKSIFDIITSAEQDDLRLEIVQTLAKNGEWKGENRLENHVTGSSVDVMIDLFVIRDTVTRESTAYAVIMTDMSEQKRLESIAIQSQKLESIGRLAGGVAHDFNNILTVILGNTDYLLMVENSNAEIRDELIEIRKNAERATDLTRQLLSFARVHAADPQIVDINAILRDMEKMMRRLIGEDIYLECFFAEDLWPIKIDPVQVQQIVTNLVVNARDAMPHGGTITIETMNIKVEQDSENDLVSGDYAVITVGDTGVGIDKQILPYVFEPFFSTKAQGKGTGLGLSTCYGIVKQNRGGISIESEPGIGTVVKIFFPKTDESFNTFEPHEYRPQLPRGKESILIVEDEESVRRTISKLCCDLGYTVNAVDNPNDALRLFPVIRENGGVDIVITDVIMPVMNGIELSRRIAELDPHVKIIFISGYSPETLAGYGIPLTEMPVIQKPFSAADIAMRIRETLDEPGDSIL